MNPNVKKAAEEVRVQVMEGFAYTLNRQQRVLEIEPGPIESIIQSAIDADRAEQRKVLEEIYRDAVKTINQNIDGQPITTFAKRVGARLLAILSSPPQPEPGDGQQ